MRREPDTGKRTLLGDWSCRLRQGQCFECRSRIPSDTDTSGSSSEGPDLLELPFHLFQEALDIREMDVEDRRNEASQPVH